jgi:carboxypeptidase PM20D1
MSGRRRAILGAATVATVAVGRRLLRRDGSAPPGEEVEPGPAGAVFLDHLAEAVRIPTVSFEEPGRADPTRLSRFHEFLRATYPRVFANLDDEVVAGHSLLLSWEGTDPTGLPVLLMAHMDVVPVEEGTEADWHFPPFAGERDLTHLWGRGTIDDKGSLVAILEAVDGLVAEGFVPTTTLYVSLGHDEELGGGEGARSVADLLAGRGVSFEFVVDEGGAVVEDVLPGARRPVALLGIGEKGYVDVELSASGAGGHSSIPPPRTAIGEVATAVAALEARPMPARVDVQQRLFEVLAGVLPPPQSVLLRNARRARPIVERLLASRPSSNALIRTTAAVTVVSGGVKPNVLPQTAAAIVNFRILPGDTVEGVLEHVRRVVGPGIDVHPLPGTFRSEPSALSDPDSSSFRLIADVIEDVFSGVAVAPWILMGATDSRHFAPIADNVYRFAPFTMTPDDMGRVHGTGERIRLADADRAVTFYSELIRRACRPQASAGLAG